MTSVWIFLFLLLKIFFLAIFDGYFVKSNRIEQNYEIKYYDIFLDHFSNKSNVTFKLRYLLSRNYWKSGRAILFYCGNEGDVINSSKRSGFIWELGQKLSAMIVFAEHRYYGTSLPFGNKSFSTPKLFRFLTSNQTLADYASLILYLKRTIVGSNQSVVIAFGGSYGGILAALFRQTYPNIIMGALASSAPILMVDNIKQCNSAFEILTKAFKIEGGIKCTNSIRNLWPLLNKMNSLTDLAYLTQTFHLCESLKEVDLLISFISDALFEVAVANNPYPYTLFRPLPARPIKVFCKSIPTDITDSSTFFNAIFKGLAAIYNNSGEMSCLPLNTPDTLSDIGWTLQTCMEFPIPLCTNGITDMFYKNEYNINITSEFCEERFKVKQGFIRTQFGGGVIGELSNVIFSNGLLDPWSAGGIFTPPNDSINIIRIPSGAHCFDLKGSHPEDPLDVRLARQMEQRIIESWIKGSSKS